MRARTLRLAPLLLSGTALAGPAVKPVAIDPKPVLDKLEVYRDEAGGFYVVPKKGAFADSDEAQKWIFYGDAKAAYQQRIFGSSEDGKSRSWMMWAPRAKGMQGADLEVSDGKATMSCRQYTDKDGQRKLTQLAADEAHTFLAKVKLQPVLWQRQAHLLARDDDGVYYYVDELREEFGGNGYRVFVGMKGAMKEMSMVNIVRDSSGEIYATKTGQLKIIAGKDGASWIKGGKKSALTSVDIQQDRYLVYRELGIYGTLGAPCDDL